MRPVKFFLPLALLAALAFSACNTLNNRRSMYTIQKVHGPYTRELEEGTWGRRKTVDQQFAETQAEKRHPKLIQAEKKPASTIVPATSPVAPLPN